MSDDDPWNFGEAWLVAVRERAEVIKRECAAMGVTLPESTA